LKSKTSSEIVKTILHFELSVSNRSLRT
jgi:hypothetical protein